MLEPAGREVCDKAGGGSFRPRCHQNGILSIFTPHVLEKRCSGHLKVCISFFHLRKNLDDKQNCYQLLHPLCLDLLISPCLDIGKYDNKISANKKSCIDRCTEEGDGCVGVA